MSVQDSIKIVGISGSLRKQSFNSSLLREAASIMPNVQFEIANISNIPFFNEDIEVPYPQAVVELKSLILSASGIVISTPEYNGMIPGVLKNTLEWLSRPGLGTPLAGKPVGIIGAATSQFGTSSAQVQLRQLAFTLNMHVLNRPVVRVGNARQKFGDDGTLQDEQTREAIKQFMMSFVEWINLLSGGVK